MSFTDDYLAIRKKKQKEETKSDIAPLFTNKTTAFFNTTKDIAPVLKETTKTEKEESKLDFFQKVEVDDGWDVAKAILGTTGDVGLNVVKGVASLGEGLGDLIAYGAAGVGDWLGKEEWAKGVRKRASENYIDALTEPVDDSLDKHSVLGRTSDAILQGVGQVGGIFATGGLASGAGLGAAGTTAVTTGTMFASGTGSGMSEAYQSGATDQEAATYGLISGAADAVTELIFGGLGKGINAVGLSKGLSSADDLLAKKLTSKITNTLAKNMVEFGVKASAEGLEEVLAGFAQAAGKKATYMSEKDFNDILEDENLLEQYVVGALTSGIAQAGDVVSSTKSGRDFITGLNADEQAVVDAEHKNRIAEREADGTKLTGKEKSMIYDSVLNDLDKGYISTDTIEEVLGGETYKSYRDTIDSEDAQVKQLEDQLKELEGASNTVGNAKKYDSLQSQLDELKSNSQRNQLKTQLSEEVFGLAKDSRLVESYNEKARRGQAFEADLTQYDAKQQETIKKAVESGILNNTRRTHEFVDMVAKISADKGVLFDFTNNTKLKESSFAVDGKFVNGYFDKKSGTIGVNIDSAKAVNTVVGHEITHVLEGTEFYNTLRDTIVEYAKSKGDYQGRIDALNKLYDPEDVDTELVADLVGDYLFTDSDFIHKLSTENRNVFQKIYDEIKYLCKVATAGSKEARELERVKKVFEDAYRAGGKASGDTKYSISDKNIKDVSTDYAYGETYFTMSYTQDGKTVATLEYGEYDGKPNVKMIEVTPEYRRKGIATKLLQELQKKYPDAEIDFGMATPDGAKLLDSITYDVTDEAVVADRKKLKDLQAELNELQEKLDVLYDTENLTEAQETEMHKLGDRWEEVYDSIRELEPTLRGKRATKTFVKTDTKFSLSDSDQENAKKVIDSLRIRARGSKYIDGYASYTAERMDREIRYSSADHIPDYAKSYITWVEPIDFIYATTTSEDFRARLKEEAGTLDIEKLKSETQPIHLTVNFETGEIVGHEGRHRMLALQKEGVDKVAVIIDALNHDKHNTKPIEVMQLKGQRFAEYRKGHDMWLHDMLPLSKRYADAARALFTNKPKSGIQFSLSDSDGKQLSKEQQEYFKDSKMRDENGNLKVMYHGSKVAGFHVFDAQMSDDDISFFFTDSIDVASSYSRSSEVYEARTFHTAKEMNKFLAEIGYDDYEVVKSGGKYTLYYDVDEAVATSDNLKDLYNEFCDYAGVGEGEANYKVYLDLKNPLVVDAEGRNWDNVSQEFYPELYEQWKNDYFTEEEKAVLIDLAGWEDYSTFKAEVERAIRDAGKPTADEYTKAISSAFWKHSDVSSLFSIASDNFSDEVLKAEAVKQMDTRDYSQKAKAEGYDGVIFKNLVDIGEYGRGHTPSTVAIAFDSNQIKSVANDKPTSDPDIRYSLSDSEGRKLSKGQAEYFKDSKAVDKDGNLQLVYHGTRNADFTVFKRNATYFTDNKAMADSYSPNGDMYEGYVNITKPYEIDAEGEKWSRIPIDDETKAFLEQYGSSVFKEDGKWRTSPADIVSAIEEAVENGDMDYDGIIIKNVDDTGSYYKDSEKHLATDYIVFNSYQFKNANNKTPTTDPDIRYSLTEYTEEEKKAHNKAVLDHFGKTYRWAETGYILLDGSKLDLSGKHEGAPGGYRTVDHRDIVDALGSDYGDDTYSGSLVQFMSEGNIRISPESDGINLSVKPNKAQEAALASFIQNAHGEVMLDIDDANGYTVVSVEYPSGTSALKVLNDIRGWFDNGTKPVVSNLSQFRSLTKNGETPKQYGKYNVYGKDIALETAQGDVAPVPESVSQAENATETAKTEQNVPIAEDVAPVVENARTDLADIAKQARRENFQGAYTHDGKQYLSDGSFVAEFNTVDETLEQSADFPAKRALKELDEAYERQIPGNYNLHTSNTDGYVKVGDFLYDAKYVNALIRAIENPVFTLSNGRGGDNALLVSGDNGRALLMPVRAGDYVNVIYEAQPLDVAMFPDDLAPIEAELDKLYQQKEVLDSRIQEAITAQDVEAFNQVGAEYEAVMDRIEELEQEAKNMDADRLDSISDADAPPEVDVAPVERADVIPLTKKAAADIAREVRQALALSNKQMHDVHTLIEEYSQTEFPSREQLFDDIRDKFGTYTDKIPDESIQEAKSYLRTYGLHVSDTIKSEIADYAHLMRKNRGRILFRNGGTDVDVLYHELNSLFPHLFPDSIISPTDQFMQIVDVANMEAETKIVHDLPDEAIWEVVDAITHGVGEYRQAQRERIASKHSRESFNSLMKDVDAYAPPVAEENTVTDAPVESKVEAIQHTVESVVNDLYPDIAPIAEKYEAIKPKPSKEPKLARATPEEQARAEVLTEEPKVDKKKSGFRSKVNNLVLDKGMIFEDLSLATGNRELQAKWNSIRYAEGKAQKLIGEGNAFVDSLKSIQEMVDKSGKTKQFYEYLYHMHNVDRMTLEERFEDTPNKAVFGDSVTADISRDATDKLVKANPEFVQWANEIYSYNKYLRELLVDGGVISSETAKLWETMYPHYVPIRRLGDDGLNINVPLDTGRTGVNAPIKRAKGGNRDILPLFDTMAQRTIQTYKAIAKNRFGVELKNTLGTTIDNEVLGVDEAIDSIDTQDGLLQEGKNGKKPTFTVFENGEKVTFEITDEMYDAMKPTNELFSGTSKVLNTISNIRRGTLTEYNPWFLLKNAVKDIQDVLINSQHAARTYASIPSAIKEMTTNGHWYQEYMDNGGDQNTYFDNQANTFAEENKALEIAKKVTGLDAISKANNIIERLPRLAEYIASRKAGRSVDVSMLDAARVTTNFAAGGDATKWLNRNGATFLNASVQGAVQQARNIREAKANGLKGWASLAAKYTLAGLPAVLLNHLLWDDDEEYEELSDYVKENYYIVGKYGDGQFVRIPKGRTVAVIQNAFEQMENLITGNDEVDLGRFLDLVVTNLAPNNPLDNNIISPIIQVANNKTWYGEDLVPTRLQDLPAAEQYDESTDSISRWLGETFNISPVKANYLLDQYSGVIGDTFLPMLTPEAESGDNSLVGNMIAPLKDMFTTDSVMNNQNVSDFYDTMDKLTTNAKSSKATDDDVLMSKYMNSVNADLSELYKQKREIQSSGLSDDRKYQQVREIQQQIDSLAENALGNYENINRDGDYAEIGGVYFQWYTPEKGDPYWRKLSDEQTTKYKLTSEAGDAHYVTDGNVHYRLDEEGEWTKISDRQLERQREVTSALGITPEEYWSKTDISFLPMSDGEYEYAFDNPDNYAVAKAVGGYDAYKTYSKELYNIKADKDANGKSISGSRKEKVLDYINNMDAEYGEKIILFKSEYPADDTYNYDIIEYLNGRDDISYEEMETILKKLGFNVDSNGNISWD